MNEDPENVEEEETENEDKELVDKKTKFEILYSEYSRPVSYFFIFSVLSCFITITTLTITKDLISDENHKRFWSNQSVKYFSISIIQLTCGLFVKYKGFLVNYSRKIVHISYFVIPQLLDTVILYFEKTVYTELWNIVIVYVLLLTLLEVIRSRVYIFRVMFSAIDRPEDRPYTTFWFVTQLSVSLPIIMGFSILFSNLERNNFIFIPLWILAFGDGLAEPIGTRFGKNKYTVKGLFVKDEYTRSLQGSFCVFFSSIVSILAYYNDFTKASITFCLMTMPILMTLAEAYSPHTWDNPIILLTGYILMTIAYYVE